MTENYVDEIYRKLSKSIARKERKAFKSSLEECSNGKYERLKEFEPKKKAPFSELTFMIAWVAALFGCIFLVLSVLVYCLIVPMFSMPVDNRITIEIVSTIMMVFDIIFAVILFIYWLGIVLIYRGKAHTYNLSALKEIIKN